MLTTIHRSGLSAALQRLHLRPPMEPGTAFND